MSYGMVIKNPQGKILIDGEHKMPKLLVHERVRLSSAGPGDDPRADVIIPATTKPIFVTQAIDETVVSDNYHGNLYAPRIFRNSNGEYNRVQLRSLNMSYTGQYELYVFVWVYEV